ncbi:hypothetical protein ACRWEH_24305, partial [Escherichia coli]
IICSPMTSLKTSIKTITYLSDIGCLEIQGASLEKQQNLVEALSGGAGKRCYGKYRRHRAFEVIFSILMLLL